MSADDDPDAVGEPVRFLLSQAGASVSGTFHALGEDGVASGALGVFSGQVSGDALSLTLVLDPEATDPGRGTFTGMVIGDSFTLRGGLVDDATGDSFSLTFEMTRGAANPLESAVD